MFARIHPEQFQQCFINWVQSVNQLTSGELISIDGKTLRSSDDTSNDQAAIHMVNAWVVSQRLVLGQVKVDEKSNEITAIPELLKLLCLKGCILTIDAMGCQKDIVKQIVDQGGDYIITLKKNQKNLYSRVESLFEEAIKARFQGFEDSEIRATQHSHGRNETRLCTVLTNVQALIDPEGNWENFHSVGMINFMRTENGKTKLETCYFISSLSQNAELFAQAIRGHWNIENQLHWVLDVAFHS